MGLLDRLTDFVYDHYRVAFLAGTGLLAAGWFLADGRRRPGHALAGWAAAVAAGAALQPCVDPESQACGPTLVRGRTSEPLVALTFDDGPWPPYTGQILDVLAEHDVKATFFVMGRQVRKHPDLVERMAREGHLVGNHTENHRNLLLCPPGLSRREIEQGTEAVASVLGRPPTWFRPPYGFRYPWTLLQARSLGQSSAHWSNCPRDWERPPARLMVERVLRRARPGDIVLLHDGNGDRSRTVEALPEMIRLLRERGFCFVRLDRMAGSVRPLRRRQVG